MSAWIDVGFAKFQMTHKYIPNSTERIHTYYDCRSGTRRLTPVSICLLLLLAISCRPEPPNPIQDLIQPVLLTSGAADTLLVSDLFFTENYALEFSPHEQLEVKYTQSEKKLVLEARQDFEGFTLLDFRLDGEIYHIPVYCRVKQKHTFNYRPETRPEYRMNVMGTFNDWSRNSLPMHDKDGDGEYEIELALDPGQYLYQFVIDDAEIWDPENPTKVDNGFGSFNSVISVPSRHTDRAFLHVMRFEAANKGPGLRFHYERQNQPEPLQKQHVFGLLNNRRVPDEQINISAHEIVVTLPPSRSKNLDVLRLVASQGGQTTNMQTVRLKDGRPLGSDQSFETWHDAVVYSIMIDRFHDGDPSNTQAIVHDSLSAKANYQGGDLQGILQKMEAGYFDSLGVNTLWISPVNDNPNQAYREWPPPHRYFSGYHGYWPIHHKRVEEKFGDLDLLKRLIETAHRNELKVLLDFTANHVHEEHPFFKEHRDWFGVLDLPDGRKNIRFWDEYRLTTWFEPFLPSFDYLGSDAALQAMTDNAVWWLKETGADGFRHDAVKHIPNRFWRSLTRKIKQQIVTASNRDIYQIGETFGSYELISSYVNNGQLNAQFNFNLYDTALYVFLNPEASFAILAKELEKTFSVYGFNHLMGNVMDSHDKVRFMAYADGDLVLNSSEAAERGWTNPPRVDSTESYEKAKLYLTYLMTIPGVPVVYYGDEIGMTGAADPDNRRMMRFDNELNESERRMLKAARQIIGLRRTHSSLRYGDFQTLIADENCFVYLRSDMHERLLVALNKSDQAQTLSLELPRIYLAGAAVGLLDGEKKIVTEDELTLRLSALSWNVFEIQ